MGTTVPCAATIGRPLFTRTRSGNTSPLMVINSVILGDNILKNMLSSLNGQNMAQVKNMSRKNKFMNIENNHYTYKIFSGST